MTSRGPGFYMRYHWESRPCAHCKETFSPKAPNQVTCSDSCRSERKRQRLRAWREESPQALREKTP